MITGINKHRIYQALRAPHYNKHVPWSKYSVIT